MRQNSKRLSKCWLFRYSKLSIYDKKLIENTNIQLTTKPAKNSKPMLCKVFIEELQKTNEKVIDKFIKSISKKILIEAKIIERKPHKMLIKSKNFGEKDLTLKKFIKVRK